MKISNLYKLTILALLATACAVPLPADTIDLRPDGDTQRSFNVTGSGIGDCLASSTEYGCINSDVESPEDSTTLDGDSPGLDLFRQEHGFENAPGDCGSVNSITLKVRVAEINNSAEDDFNVWLDVSRTQSGGTKLIDAFSGAADCNLSGTSISDCSFTDSAWDALSCGDVDNLTWVAQPATNNQGMPDNSTFRTYEVEVLLDYNVAGADDSLMVIQ